MPGVLLWYSQVSLITKLNIMLNFTDCDLLLPSTKLCYYIIPYGGGGGWFFIFWLFVSILLFVKSNFMVLFPFLIKFYHIMCIIIVFRVGSEKLFSCFFSGFLLFSPKGSVTGCDSSIGSFCYSRIILHIVFMHLRSGYYYYYYVIMGVLRPLWLNWNSPLCRLCCVLWG